MSRENDSFEPEHPKAQRPSAVNRWLWFIGLWIGGVAAVALVALIIRSAII